LKAGLLAVAAHISSTQLSTMDWHALAKPILAIDGGPARVPENPDRCPSSCRKKLNPVYLDTLGRAGR
jgi:hypothetical protein